ncbi:TPA: ABC transporter ATP-binding protein [Staphylococcus aureus]|uniref:ABC transporter ATP-binding protein n=1 Tax=Staphylococcus aureus TaxID=1280 RepID=UPI000A4AC1D9|nr:ABC transporter ATP-binding protein [Staphylococcus aureus]HBO5454969.1 ABC transporter ATP-binding protein [Pseudomonas aeruginosa]MBS3285570.1 ABC transporter ATP-binding protein [Staphylococcus aureus]MBS3293541.1 ABC transporter ATP-binding protein [Staphylococcus aureus]MBS3304202.1 ABC transporter ATP-binding protein [Staphylococcus aureus]MBS3339140.1 ABC transporter ATP-binding protein [Staphylococcus aureus]
MLKLENVSKKFKSNVVVDNISFELLSGKMLGFLGRNGAGKTTTFRMILGLVEASSGEITYNNQKIDPTTYNYIGYLPEERGLHPKLKVKKELQYMAGLKNMNKSEIDSSITYWLKEFKIEKYKNKKIEELSKGNQQKIQLIASIIHNPQLLILDEPFSGLDPVNVELLKKAIKQLNNSGTMIIFSTHRMEHVEELCDDICIMKDGKIEIFGNIKEIKKKYSFKQVLIESNENLDYLMKINGVIKRTILKNGSIFRVKDNKTANNLFEESKKIKQLSKFEILEPSINEIFIETVGDLDE